MKRRNVRVAIIGAGVSGLSAAERLFACGFQNVIILEALDRIGGRVRTVQHGDKRDYSVDLGATYIDGDTKKNSFFALAKDEGLLPKELNYHDSSSLASHQYSYTSDGRRLSQLFSHKAWNLFNSWFLECPSSPSINVHDHLKQRLLREMSEHFSEAEAEDAKAMLNSFLNWYSTDQGVSVRDLKNIPLPAEEGYDDMPGKLVMPPRCMGSVVRALAGKLPEGTVQFNKEVVRVDWGGSEVQIECRGGDLYYADHVVVTISLGCLKHSHVTFFKPALPEKKVQAIQKIPFGKMGKICLRWKKPFWEKGKGTINLAWRDVDWFGMETKCAKDWYKMISCFTEVLTDPHALIAWVTGDETKYAESLPLDQMRRDITAILRHFLKNDAIEEPTEILRSDWCSNPSFHGVYSYWDMNTKSTDMLMLGEPLSQTGSGTPKVLFAGEATNPEGYGYVHGARDSGIREADRLIMLYPTQLMSRL